MNEFPYVSIFAEAHTNWTRMSCTHQQTSVSFCPLNGQFSLLSVQAAAISNHAIQAEELSVVVIQVIQLVLHFVEELRALREANIGVQVHIIIKEVRNSRVEEVRLELMPGIANAVKTWKVVPLISIHVLGLVGVDAQVVLRKVQAASFATAGAKGNVVHEGIVIFLGSPTSQNGRLRSKTLWMLPQALS